MDFHQTWYVHWYWEIWFGIANGQISSSFSAQDTPIFLFQDDNLSK